MQSLMSIQSVSLILLLGGIALAFSHIRLSDWVLGWILLSGALLLQGFRSMLSYVAGHGGVDATTYTIANDWMGLGFSLLVVASMHLMREVFVRHRLASESVRVVGAAANDATIITDKAGIVTDWNRAAQRIFGYGEQEALGKALPELVVPERYRDEFERMFDRFCSADPGAEITAPAELPGLRSDGTEILTEYSMSPVVVDRKWHLFYVVRDITARRQAEEAERKYESEAQFRATFETSSVGMTLFDPYVMRLLRVNHRCCEMFGYSEAELLGKTFPDLTHADDRDAGVEGMARLVRGEIQELRFQTRYVRKDGNLLWCDLTVNVVRDSVGRPEIAAAVLQDISAYRRTQQDLSQAKDAAERASRAKSIFLANMSHEIRTPLHNIIGLAQLLRRDAYEPRQRGRLDDLCGSSEHLLSVINDVLDLSKIEADRLVLDQGDFVLGHVLARVISVVAASAQDKGLNLALDVGPPLYEARLRGDALRLGQVLINLLANAIKFSERGTITLSVQCLGENAAGLKLRFEAKDQGIGIAPENRARLFDAFEQADNTASRRYDGSGLGLTISDWLVRAMGGTIDVESTLGAGSVFGFVLEFPRGTHPPEDEAELSEPYKPVTFRGSHVLVAEDHPLSRELMRQMLSELGCTVDLAKDGAEAVECARARAYDLILVDIQMPRLDGLAATRAIRGLPEHARTPILAITANAFVEDRERCIEAGMNGHLTKPLTPASLSNALGHWLAESNESYGHAAAGAEAAGFASDAPDLFDANAILGGTIGQGMTQEFILGEFLRLHRDDLAQVRARLAFGDVETARKLVHNLEGACAMIGARRLRSAIAELDTALRSGMDPSAVAARVAASENELAQLVAAGG